VTSVRRICRHRAPKRKNVLVGGTAFVPRNSRGVVTRSSSVRTLSRRRNQPKGLGCDFCVPITISARPAHGDWPIRLDYGRYRSRRRVTLLVCSLRHATPTKLGRPQRLSCALTRLSLYFFFVVYF